MILIKNLKKYKNQLKFLKFDLLNHHKFKNLPDLKDFKYRNKRPLLVRPRVVTMAVVAIPCLGQGNKLLETLDFHFESPTFSTFSKTNWYIFICELK